MKTIKLKKIKPMFTSVLTTADKFTEQRYMPGTMIIDPTASKTGLKEYQTVLAVGDSVRNVKVGDLICINPERYAVRKYSKDSMKSSMEEYNNVVVSYNFHMVDVDGKECLFIDDRDIDFVVEEYEFIEEETISPLTSVQNETSKI